MRTSEFVLTFLKNACYSCLLKLEIFDIKAYMFVHKKCDTFLSETRCSNEWVHLYEVKISNDYELSYFQMTNSKEDEIHMNLRELIDKGKCSIIALQNEHWNVIMSRKNGNSVSLLFLEWSHLICGNNRHTIVFSILCEILQTKILSLHVNCVNVGCIQISFKLFITNIPWV